MGKSKNVYFISIRLRDWLHILGLPILGIVYHSKVSLWTYNSLLGMIISSLYLAHGYSLNTYFDTHIEPYWNKIRVLIFSYFIFLINCIISLSHSLLIFYLVIIGSFAGLIYSAPPFRLKRIIPLNIILNSFGFSLLFIIGFVSVSKTITVFSIPMAILFALIFIPLQIIHQICHSEIDKRGKIRTICSTYGPKITVRFFNLSLLLIVSWVLIISTMLGNKHIYLFYATCLFALSLFYFMRKLKIDENIDISVATKTRLIFRRICILYGIVIFLIYMFIK